MIGAYNASKAALHAYSDTLRVELAPFDVKVVIMVTGGVQSQIARLNRFLPENSIYVPINAEYKRRLKHSQEGAMPNEVYAKSVVDKVTKPRPSFWIWEGKNSWSAWFMYTFCPKGWMVGLIGREMVQMRYYANALYSGLDIHSNVQPLEAERKSFGSKRV